MSSHKIFIIPAKKAKQKNWNYNKDNDNKYWLLCRLKRPITIMQNNTVILEMHLAVSYKLILFQDYTF